MTSDDKKAALSATVVAFSLIAVHVASRATRDALFLTSYDISSLPYMVIGSAVVSALSVVLTAWGLRKMGPAIILRAGCLFSACLFIIETLLLDAHPRAVPILAFLHITSLGALLISAFWSHVNERFDPHSGKKAVARIEAAATLGGVGGGISAERVAEATSTPALLVLCAGLCGVALLFSWWRPRRGESTPIEVARPVALGQVVKSRYVQSLATIVVLVAVGSTLLDYVFKSQATQIVSHENSLARLFSVYYTITGLLAFIVEAVLAPWILRHLGPVGSLGTLPGSVGVMGGTLLLFPGFWSIAVVRGLEAVLQNSLYRSGYELLFIPIDAALKRKAKAALDVGMDKFGDSLAAGLILVLLAVVPKPDFRMFVALSMITSMAALYVAYRIRAQYISTLGAALENPVRNAGGRWRDTKTTRPLNRSRIGRHFGDAVAGDIVPAYEPLSREIVRRIDVRFKLRRKQLLAILEKEEFDLNAATFLIPHLEDDDLRNSVESYLMPHATACTGSLLDYLLDPTQPEKLRRRIPRLLRFGDPERAAPGLLRALDDPDFEVQFRAAIALSGLIDRHSPVAIEKEVAFACAKRALDAHDKAWERVIVVDEDDIQVSVLGPSERNHYNKGLQLVFEILGLTLDRDLLRQALRSLWGGDSVQRGTALEYLRAVLPDDLRDQLWPKLKVADQLPPPTPKTEPGPLVSEPKAAGRS